MQYFISIRCRISKNSVCFQQKAWRTVVFAKAQRIPYQMFIRPAIFTQLIFSFIHASRYPRRSYELARHDRGWSDFHDINWLIRLHGTSRVFWSQQHAPRYVETSITVVTQLQGATFVKFHQSSQWLYPIAAQLINAKYSYARHSLYYARNTWIMRIEFVKRFQDS